MNILLDGCDGAGKTTLANLMVQLDGRYRIIHLSAPHSYEDGKHMYADMLHQLWSKNFLIFDRAHLSEMVYAPIFRDYAPYYMSGLELMMPSNTLLVHVYADEPCIKDRFDGHFIAESQIPQILKSYHLAYQMSTIPKKYEVNTTYMPAIEAAWHILTTAEVI